MVELPLTLGLITLLFFVVMSSNELKKDLEVNGCKLHTLTNDSAEFYNMQIVQFIYFPIYIYIKTVLSLQYIC
jgi:hypothetical protein